MELAWYLRRLHVMGVRETFHRIHEQCDLCYLRLTQPRREKKQTDFQPHKFIFCRGTLPVLPSLDWDMEANKQVADRCLKGEWPALGFDWSWQGQARGWDIAPDSGGQWPKVFFGSIPYREGNPHGDIRVAWEPSRLQQLVSLALLAADESYRYDAVNLFEAQLLCWVAANPPYRGIHYISSMECSLRLLSICYAVDLIRPYLKQPECVWQAVLQLVQSHANLIERRLSLYSSSGNHTIAETAGLVYSGLLFPEFRRANRWLKKGMVILKSEAHRQFLPDGGGIEQAFGYHLFITDLCNLVVRLLHAKGLEVSWLSEIATKAQYILGELFDPVNKLPHVGDNDGGFALSPFLRISHQPRSCHAVHATFSHAGYSLIRIGGEREGFLLFDHGPLGMAPAYGHGHSDCLSVCLQLGKDEVLIDPGTYTYTGKADWRRYFRGATAHNTVSIDGFDQAVQQSSFMWTDPFHAYVVHKEESLDGAVVILARHNGYEKRLGVTHWRAVFYQSPNVVLVWDCLTGVGKHGLELNWHLGFNPEIVGQSKLLRCGGSTVYLEVDGGIHSLHYGETSPIRGWRSRYYGRKEPITTLRNVYTGNLPHEFVTRIWIGNDTQVVQPTFPQLTVIRKIVHDSQSC